MLFCSFFSEVAFAFHTLAFISGSYSVTPTGLQNSLIGCVGHLKSEFGLVKVCPGSPQNKLFFFLNIPMKILQYLVIM